MFAFAIIAVLAVSFVTAAVVGISTYEDPRAVSTTTTNPTNDESIQWNKKDKKSKEEKTLIGLVSPTFVAPKSDYTPTYTFDSTTYKDKCTLKITNNTGVNNLVIFDFAIRGIPVYRYAGKNGYKFEHLNKTDIEANGEIEYKVSNNYITSSGQCEIVGDYVRKELEPHDMYTVTLHGVHPYFQIGDKYELNVDYQHPSMPFPTELIAIDVEIRGVSISRGHDNIGSTILTCRVPSDAWSKTTSTKAKWISSGLPFDKLNRANVLTIGAYDYPGQADVYCDGVDDDVQIQEAIDNLSAAGGGTIQLSRGLFILCSGIVIKSGIKLLGEGDATVLSPKDNTVFRMITAGTIGTQQVTSLCIDGDSDNITFILPATGSYVIYDGNASKLLKVTNITIQNYQIEVLDDDADTDIYIINGLNDIIGCTIQNIYSDNAVNIGFRLYIAGYYQCKNITNSTMSNSIITLINKYLIGYYYCDGLVNCYFNNNTTGQIRAYAYCNYLSSCASTNNSASVYNGFYGCKNITVSSSISNIGSGSEYGFNACNSVQQCKSDDSTKYSTSYADSGTAQLCQDNANGGYNS